MTARQASSSNAVSTAWAGPSLGGAAADDMPAAGTGDVARATAAPHFAQNAASSGLEYPQALQNIEDLPLDDDPPPR
jgi:hypothetical protein